MSDYTPVEGDFTAKDSLSVGDPEKLVLGADLDAEFSALQTAIATKYDSSDIATKVQAEAGSSNSVLMTPLRVAEQIADSGGSGAGIVNDLIALADPDADRILFWDDSAGAAAYLTVGTGLTLSNTTLTADNSAVDHDSLQNFVANEHIDHTAVTITAGVGLQYSSGGTDISASATLALDINGLTEELTLDTTTDDIAFYDDSAGTIRKLPLANLIGTALGDGKWYKNSTTSLSDATEITVAFNTAEYDSLQKGTFSTSTGEYTNGSTATRLWVSVIIKVTGPEGSDIQVRVQVNGTTKLAGITPAGSDYGSHAYDCHVSGALTLASGDVVRVRVESGEGVFTVATPISAGTAFQSFSIQELA